MIIEISRNSDIFVELIRIFSEEYTELKDDTAILALCKKFDYEDVILSIFYH